MQNFTKLLFAGAMAIPMIGNTQVNVSTTPENRNAVIEEWTGIYCGYCPSGHVAVDQAIASNPGDVIALNIHTGSYADPSGGDPDFRTTDGDENASLFTISGYPASTLNRRTIGGSQTYHPAESNDANKVPQVISEVSEVNMHITATVDIVTRVLNVDVEYYYTADAPNSTNFMYVALLQNHVEGPQSGGAQFNPTAVLPNGNYDHTHMLRDFISPVWGDTINTTTTGATAIMSYTQTLPMDINGVALELANLEIAAFINDGNQANGDILTGLSVHPQLVGFTSTDEVIFSSAANDNIESCDGTAPQTVSPTTTITNWGSNTMTSATITYDINGGTSEVMNWTGSVAPGASTQITLDPITFTPIAGTNTVNVSVSNPNGVADNTADNSGSGTFEVLGALVTGYQINVDFFTDNYPAETSWEILSSSGTVVASGGPYSDAGNTNGVGGADALKTISSSHTLPNGVDCYSIKFNDTYGDGQGYGTGTNPQGGYGIEVKSYGNVIVNWDAGDGWSDIERVGAMKTDASSGVGNINIENVSIFPNPASDVLNISFNAEASTYNVAILDLQGRVLATESGSQNVTFPVGELSAGSYLVTISTESGVYTENVVIK
jgi:hypothetical protein